MILLYTTYITTFIRPVFCHVILFHVTPLLEAIYISRDTNLSMEYNISFFSILNCQYENRLNTYFSSHDKEEVKLFLNYCQSALQSSTTNVCTVFLCTHDTIQLFALDFRQRESHFSFPFSCLRLLLSNCRTILFNHFSLGHKNCLTCIERMVNLKQSQS